MVEVGDFDAFVNTNSPSLLRAAWALTGDWYEAQDLTQTTLEATWRRWATIVQHPSPEAYVHRVLVSSFLRSRRRRWTREFSVPELPDERPAVDGHAAVDIRDSLRTALETLSAPQRAAVVLRFFLDLSEIDTAEAMGCSIGTVKSHTSRALRRLRMDPALWGTALKERG